MNLPELRDLAGLEEPFSAVSHLLGAAVFVVLGIALLRRGRGDRARMVFLGIYAASCVLLMSVSGVYHMLPRGSEAGLVMKRLDHAAIFVLIAGTFTPPLGILLRGWLRWGQLVLVWAAAIAGIALMTIVFDGRVKGIGLSMYLALGWFGGLSAILLARRLDVAFIMPLLWGGLVYSIGGVIDYFGWPTIIPGVIHAHEILHVAVLAGAILHWRFIWQFADGQVPSAAVGDVGLVQPLQRPQASSAG